MQALRQYRHALNLDFHKALHFAAWGAGGGVMGSLLGEFVNDHRVASFSELIFNVSLWFGIIGSLIASAIYCAQAYYWRRRFQIDRTLFSIVCFGFLGGALAGALAQVTYSGIGPTEVLRIICWGIAGGLLGLVLSFRIPNLSRLRGLGGGLAGGLLGGCLFILFGLLLGEVSGRVVGIGAIGFAIGFMIILADSLFREAWLEISYGTKETRTVSLGLEPIKIGSDSTSCTVYVPHVPAIAYVYKLDHGSVIFQDLAAGQTSHVGLGDCRQLGNLTVTVQAAGQIVQPNAATPKARPAETFWLRLSPSQVYPLYEDCKLSNREISGLEPQGTNGAVAEVNRHPMDPGVLGLKNSSQRAWQVQLPTGEKRQVEPGRSIKLAVGTKIDFGPIEGEIQL